MHPCVRGTTRYVDLQHGRGERQHNCAAAYSAPSTAASAAAAQARPITSFFQREETSSTPVAAVAGTATGAKVSPTALAQQTTPLQVCGSSNSLQASVITHPFYHTSSLPNPLQVCGSVITHPGLSHLRNGPCDLHVVTRAT